MGPKRKEENNQEKKVRKPRSKHNRKTILTMYSTSYAKERLLMILLLQLWMEDMRNRNSDLKIATSIMLSIW